MAKLFPGAVLCFCTLRPGLSSQEKKKITQIARQGRRSLRTGQRQNPVLVLTQTELLGQFKIGSFVDDYPGQFSKFAESAFLRGDLQEICDFTLQVHLGIESYHDWVRTRYEARRTRRLTVNQPQTAKPKIPEP